MFAMADKTGRFEPRMADVDRKYLLETRSQQNVHIDCETQARTDLWHRTDHYEH